MNENVSFGDFEGSIKFTDWSEFKNNVEKSFNTGFETIEDLVSLMGMNISLYNKIKNHMVFNWKDSVTKSLLHTVSNLDGKFPKEGDSIFIDMASQQRFLILCSSGYNSRDVFGNFHGVDGLNIISQFKLKRIPNTDPNAKEYDKSQRKDVMSVFVKIGGQYAYTLEDNESIEKANDVIKYVWLYVFYNKDLLGKGLKNKKIKLPKYLYRGIRFNNAFGSKNKELQGKIEAEIKELYKDLKGRDGWTKPRKHRIDASIDHVIKNGLSEMVDGKFLSFTASVNIAKYFSNHQGFIIRIDPKKVDIITSELTDELFDRPDNFNGKKEREYIVRVPDDYKFTREDFILTDVDYLISENNPLAVEYFNHDDKHAEYDYLHNDELYHVHAAYHWSSNSKGSVSYTVTAPNGSMGFGMGTRECLKRFGFNPLPTEDNLDKIKNVNVYVKDRW